MAFRSVKCKNKQKIENQHEKKSDITHADMKNAMVDFFFFFFFLINMAQFVKNANVSIDVAMLKWWLVDMC